MLRFSDGGHAKKASLGSMPAPAGSEQLPAFILPPRHPRDHARRASSPDVITPSNLEVAATASVPSAAANPKSAEVAVPQHVVEAEAEAVAESHTPVRPDRSNDVTVLSPPEQMTLMSVGTDAREHKDTDERLSPLEDGPSFDTDGLVDESVSAIGLSAALVMLPDASIDHSFNASP